MNRFLLRHGVRQPLIRRVLRIQCYAACLLLAVGLVLLPATFWFFWVGVGAVVSVVNFLSLTKSAPTFMVNQYTVALGARFFIRSQIRLLLLVAAGAVCVAFLGAPAGALLVGFSVILALIVAGVLIPRKRNA